MPDVQEAYEKISAAAAEPCPYPASRSGVQVDGEDVGWRSPRMMLALAQAGGPEAAESPACREAAAAFSARLQQETIEKGSGGGGGGAAAAAAQPA